MQLSSPRSACIACVALLSSPPPPQPLGSHLVTEPVQIEQRLQLRLLHLHGHVERRQLGLESSFGYLEGSHLWELGRFDLSGFLRQSQPTVVVDLPGREEI